MTIGGKVQPGDSTRHRRLGGDQEFGVEDLIFMHIEERDAFGGVWVLDLTGLFERRDDAKVVRSGIGEGAVAIDGLAQSVTAGPQLR